MFSHQIDSSEPTVFAAVRTAYPRFMKIDALRIHLASKRLSFVVGHRSIWVAVQFDSRQHFRSSIVVVDCRGFIVRVVAMVTTQVLARVHTY